MRKSPQQRLVEARRELRSLEDALTYHRGRRTNESLLSSLTTKTAEQRSLVRDLERQAAEAVVKDAA